MIISKITPILTITINGRNDTGSPNLNAQSVLVCSGRQTYLELAQSQKYIFRCSSFWKIKFLNFYSGWEKPLVQFSNRLVKRWNLIRNDGLFMSINIPIDSKNVSRDKIENVWIGSKLRSTLVIWSDSKSTESMWIFHP